MDTLLEFLTFTKGMEYLLAIAFLLAFVAFWALVYGRGKRAAIKIAVLSLMSLGLVIQVGSCVATAPH